MENYNDLSVTFMGCPDNSMETDRIMEFPTIHLLVQQPLSHCRGLLLACHLPATSLLSDALAAPSSVSHSSLEAGRISGFLSTCDPGGAELRTSPALPRSALTTD